MKSLVLCGVLSPAAMALSLYDTAPPIGLPESHAVRYTASMSAGYDDNLNSTSGSDRKGGGFIRFGVGASYADYESVDKVNYSAHIGGTLYNKTAQGTDQRLFSDIGLSGSLTHSFSAASVYSLHASLSYRPEPDYANGISAARTQGDCLNWSVSNAYSQSIDSRWSWTATAGYSGNIYSNSVYQVDDRQYVNTGLSLNFRYSSLTTYSANASYRYDLRRYGFDSENLYLTGTVSRSIDAVSSFSLTAGAQVKFIDGQCKAYPNLRGAYRRTLSEGLSVSAYVSFDNENVDTYNRQGNYRSNETWRVGTDFQYRFSPKVSFSFGASLLSSSYSDGTNGLGNRERTTWTAHVGMSYAFTSSLSGNVNYNYTRQSGAYDYHRNVVSAGVSYAF